jgi:SAM-dependent methyltransferase
LAGPFAELLGLQCAYILDAWRPPPGARLLDVGGAEGFFLRHLSERLEGRPHCELVEPSKEYGRVASVVVPGVTIHECMLEDTRLGMRRFDLISLRHVLEHVQGPLAVLRTCRELLDPAGLLHLELPNAAVWPPSVSSLFHHEHLNYFVPETLAAALGASGFRVVSLQPFSRNPVGSGFSYPVIRALASPAHDEDCTTRAAVGAKVPAVSSLIRAQMAARSEFIRLVVGPIRERVAAHVQGGRKVAMFGAGPHTLDLMSVLQLPDDTWSFIVDNNPNKWGRSMKNIEVKAPSRGTLEKVQAIVISSEAFESEMCDQVRSFGIPNLDVIRIYGHGGRPVGVQ